MKHKQTNKKITELSQLTNNPRINYDADKLVPSILDRGLDTRIMTRPDGAILRGNRRFKALQIIAENYAEQFAKLFKNGIPVVEVSGATDREYASLVIDHGNTKPLSDPFELQLAANTLFAVGYTEGEVANHLAGLIDQINPMKMTKRQEFAELRKTDGEKVFQTKYAEYRRGKVQGLKAVFSCPEIVMQSRRAHATGADKDKYPKLTDSQVKTLQNAFVDDLGILTEDGTPRYNKRETGEAFQAAWKRIKEKPAKKVEKRPKAWDKKKLEKQDAEITSHGFHLLNKQHRGEPVEVSAISYADALLFIAERVKDLDPAIWNDCEQIVEETINAENELKDKPSAETK